MVAKFGLAKPNFPPDIPEDKVCYNNVRCKVQEHTCCGFCPSVKKCLTRCPNAWQTFTYPQPINPHMLKCSSLRKLPDMVWELVLDGKAGEYY